MLTRTDAHDVLARAAQLHGAGRSDDAIALCQRALQKSAKAWQPMLLLGLIRRERNELREAEALLTRAHRINPSHADICFHLACVRSDLGMAKEAIELFERVLARDGRNASAHFRLGSLHESTGDLDQAATHYAAAARLDPAASESLVNLGNVRRAQGQGEAAVAAFTRAIEVDAACAVAHLNLGLALADAGQDEAALRALETACKLDPDNAQFHFLRGVFLNQRKRLAAAGAAYEQALRCAPNHAGALNNFGVLRLEAGDESRALDCFEHAVSVDPGFPEGWNNLGNLHIRQERWPQARAAFETALRCKPDFTPALAGMGTVLNEAGALAEARRCYEAVLAQNAENVQILAALANVLQRQGDLDHAHTMYGRAIGLSGSDALRIKQALMLSAVMIDEADIARQRERVADAVADLRARDPRTTEEELLRYPDTCFFLAYHGCNDKALLAGICALLLQACPTLAYTAPHSLEPACGEGRIRVGFVSRYFHRHSVGLFFDPVIAALAMDERFEIVLFSIGEKDDDMQQALAQACARHVRIRATSLAQARRLIERERLDILVYPEIGMDPFTWLLSFARLARVQCVLQGHSNTTGVPAIDWYVSSALIEPPDAREHYTERLALLPTLPMVLAAPPPRATIDARGTFGLPADTTLYLCPMKLQKVHPGMDAAFAAILRRDPRAILLLVLDHGNEAWAQRMQSRLRDHLGEAYGRIVFVPWQAQIERFLALLASCDIVLDTFHHGGATTSHLALACGKAVVTWPGAHARGRFLHAYYRLLEVEDCIAASAEEYVDIAVALAADCGRRKAIEARILARIDRLYDNEAVFDAYAALFTQLAARREEIRLPPAYRPLATIADWCSGRGARYEVLAPARDALVPAPVIAGMPATGITSRVTLPECFLAELGDVTVIGGEKLMLADDERTVLYDDALRYPDARVDIAAGVITHRCHDEVLLKSLARGAPLDCGIHLLGRGATNYYHWLLEYLPRLQALEQAPQYAGWPLLVDAQLHPNLLTALERVCPQRQIIAIEPGVAHAARHIVAIGPRIWMPVDYRAGATVYPDDILVAPEALTFLRERLAGARMQGKASRRLYLRRGDAAYRRLVNEDRIEGIFIEHGFEVVVPESLSLDEQIALFSQAEAIAGPTGAAMTNMLFAPPGCHVMVLYYPNVPYFYFSTPGAALGHEVVYLLGESLRGSHAIPYQLDFRLDPGQAEAAVVALVERIAARTAQQEADNARARRLASRHRAATGFLLHIPELINHYREMLGHLRGTAVEIVNAGTGADHDRIAALADGLGIAHRSVDACRGQPRYRCLVSNHPVDPSGDPLIKRLAHVNVRMMYALGKAGWNMREWNALYDAILCFGPYHAEALAGVSAARLVQVGYPRFDPFFHGTADRAALLSRHGCDPAKPTLVWLPTWKSLSSVALHANAITGLQARYNVIVKLHPLAADDGSGSEAILRAAGIDRVITDSSDNLPLYRIADHLLCDYGGPAFGGIYTDRRVLLLNVPDAAFDPLVGPDSPDILIRQVMTNVDPMDTTSLAAVLGDESSWEAQRRVRDELRAAFFAPYYGFSARVAAGAIENIDHVIGARQAPSW